jgi:hypothetical protein
MAPWQRNHPFITLPTAAERKDLAMNDISIYQTEISMAVLKFPLPTPRNASLACKPQPAATR